MLYIILRSIICPEVRACENSGLEQRKRNQHQKEQTLALHSWSHTACRAKFCAVHPENYKHRIKFPSANAKIKRIKQEELILQRNR